jgi:hypothetical protein
MMIKNELPVRLKLTKATFSKFYSIQTGGRNGYGAKVTNIFSTKFTVETCSKEYKKSFRQVSFLFLFINYPKSIFI